MFHKITSLAALPDYILLVGFADGEFRQFDLKPLMNKYPPFAALKTVNGLYEQARIDAGGYGVVWNDDLDISAEGIYEKGAICDTPDDIEKYRQDLLAALAKARRDARLSQKQLEVLSGVAQPCIARTETGATDPKLSTLLKLLEPLGLTLSVTSIRPSAAPF